MAKFLNQYSSGDLNRITDSLNQTLCVKLNDHTNLSAFHFPDYYFKTKGDEMDVRNPKHSVGTLFARNK